MVVATIFLKSRFFLKPQFLKSRFICTNENEVPEITEIALENTEKIAVNILHENTEEAKSNEIDPCINVNAKQIEAIVKQGLGPETNKEFTLQRTQQVHMDLFDCIDFIL